MPCFSVFITWVINLFVASRLDSGGSPDLVRTIYGQHHSPNIIQEKNICSFHFIRSISICFDAVSNYLLFVHQFLEVVLIGVIDQVRYWPSVLCRFLRLLGLGL